MKGKRKMKIINHRGGDAAPTVGRLPRFGARDRKDGVAFLQEMPEGCNDGLGLRENG